VAQSVWHNSLRYTGDIHIEGLPKSPWETEATEVVRLKIKTPWETEVLVIDLNFDITPV
jgi:hypothetical protein